MKARPTPTHHHRLTRDVCITILLLAIAMLISGCGITGNNRFNDGYADFDLPRGYGYDRVVGLSLGRLPISIARWAIDEDDDPETAAMLEGLEAVRVYVYEIDHADPVVVAPMAEKLEDRGWTTVVRAREDGEDVRVMLKLRDQGIAGMVVIATEPSEAVFVNLIGDFQADYFNQAMAGMDLGIDVQLDDDQVEQVRLAQAP